MRDPLKVAFDAAIHIVAQKLAIFGLSVHNRERGLAAMPRIAVAARVMDCYTGTHLYVCVRWLKTTFVVDVAQRGIFCSFKAVLSAGYFGLETDSCSRNRWFGQVHSERTNAPTGMHISLAAHMPSTDRAHKKKGRLFRCSDPCPCPSRLQAPSHFP